MTKIFLLIISAMLVAQALSSPINQHHDEKGVNMHQQSSINNEEAASLASRLASYKKKLNDADWFSTESSSDENDLSGLLADGLDLDEDNDDDLAGGDELLASRYMSKKALPELRRIFIGKRGSDKLPLSYFFKRNGQIHRIFIGKRGDIKRIFIG